MPELPEVERARTELESCAVGQRVVWTEALEDEIVYVDKAYERMKHALEGRRVQEVIRKGKNLCLVLDGEGDQVAFHFGMTGAFKIQGMESISYQSLRKGSKRSPEDNDQPADWPPKYTKLELRLENGANLAFVDPRRLGRIRVVHNPQEEAFWRDLGPDVKDDMPDGDTFIQMLERRKSAAIKAILLDQNFVSGIGNWIADEVLYHSRLHPERRAESLSRPEVLNLRDSIMYVIRTAVEANSDSAKYPRNWLFHYRWGKRKESKTFDCKAIKFVTVGSRTSAFVPELQKVRKTKPKDDDLLTKQDDQSPETPTRDKPNEPRPDNADTAPEKREEIEVSEVRNITPSEAGAEPQEKAVLSKPSVEDSDDDSDSEVQLRRSARKRTRVNYATDNLLNAEEEAPSELGEDELLDSAPSATAMDDLSSNSSEQQRQVEKLNARPTLRKKKQKQSKKRKDPSNPERAEQLFQVLDRGSKGIITKEDVAYASEEYGMGFFQEEIDPMIRRFTTNNGDGLTKTDLLNILNEVV